MRIVLFCSLLLTAITTAAGLAHVFELFTKLRLSPQEYLIVQQIYRGWAFLGIPVIGSVLLNLVLAILLWRSGRTFGLGLAAFLCMAASQAVFWAYTFPVNQQTQNWTILTPNWMALRNQWEFSHAAGAGFDVTALVLLFLIALSRRDG